MTPDPSTFHRALLVRPTGGSRRAAPAAALVVLVAPVAAGPVAVGAVDEVIEPWVVLGVLGALAALALGLAHLPDGPRPAPSGVWTAALLVERVLLLAACAAAAAQLLTSVAPHVAATVLAVVLAMVVLAVRVGPWPAARRRATTGLGWAAAGVLAVVVAAGIRAAAVYDSPTQPYRGPEAWASLGEVVAVGSAVAVSGAVLQPALLGSRRNALSRSVAAGLAVAAVVAVVSTGLLSAVLTDPLLLRMTGSGLGEQPVPWVAAVLAGGLLAAAMSALSGVPRAPGTWLVSRRWPAGAAGRRLSAVVVLLAVVAVLASSGDTGVLVACYAVVVLTLGLLTLTGGRREWRRRLDVLNRPGQRRHARRGLAVTGAAAGVTAALLVLAAARGWAAIIAVGLVSAMMWGVSRHDRDLRASLALRHAGEDRPLPTVVRAFVVVAELDRTAVRAVAFARAMRATSVEALTVPAGGGGGTALREQWATLDLPVPLVELAAPPGDPAAGVVAHVAAARRDEPDGLAVVYLPEVTARRWWRRALLGSGPRRLRRRLLALPGTVVTTVPWPTEKS